jgi:AcrR family transcriptional regulator
MHEFTERQKQIIEAAIQIISEGGIQELSIRKLAEIVGISEPAIYRHFENKADIMMNIGLFLKGNWQEAMKWTEKFPGIEAIEQFLRNGMKFFSENTDIAATIYGFKTSLNYTRLLGGIVPPDEPFSEIFDKFIKRGQNEENIRSDIPAEQLTAIIKGAMWGLIEEWHLSGRNFDLVAKWESLWEALKKMITPLEY